MQHRGLIQETLLKIQKVVDATPQREVSNYIFSEDRSHVFG